MQHLRRQRIDSFEHSGGKIFRRQTPDERHPYCRPRKLATPALECHRVGIQLYTLFRVLRRRATTALRKKNRLFSRFQFTASHTRLPLATNSYTHETIVRIHRPNTPKNSRRQRNHPSETPIGFYNPTLLPSFSPQTRFHTKRLYSRPALQHGQRGEILVVEKLQIGITKQKKLT